MNKKLTGFTLVELIIVITILAILASISFVGYSGYVKDSKNTKIVSNIGNIEKGFNLYNAQYSKFPINNGVVISSGSTILGYQGYINNELLSKANINLDLNAEKYYYGVSKNNEKLELLSFNEDKKIISSQQIHYIVSDENDIIYNSGNIDLLDGNYKKLIYAQNYEITGTGIQTDELNYIDSMHMVKVLDNMYNLKSFLSSKNILFLRNSSSIFSTFLTNLGVSYSTASYTTTDDIINTYNPDLVVCDRNIWDCDLFFRRFYERGISVLSIGNDTTWSYTISNIFGRTNKNAGNIIPDGNDHFLKRGWSSLISSGNDGRYGVTKISDNAISIAYDDINNFSEVQYLEEPGMGKRLHFQNKFSTDELTKRGLVYLLTD